MTKTHTYKPLSLRLKLILTFLYLTCLGYTLNAIATLQDKDSKPELLRDYAFSYETYAAALFIFAALLAWVIYNFHMRKATTGISFAVTLIVIYGLSGDLVKGNLLAEPWSVFWSALATTGISVVVTVFLLRSKEATSQLNKK